MEYQIEVDSYPRINAEERAVVWPYSAVAGGCSVKGVIVLPWTEGTLAASFRSAMEQLTAMFPPPAGVNLCPWLTPVENVAPENPAKRKRSEKSPKKIDDHAPVAEEPALEVKDPFEGEGDHESGRAFKPDEVFYVKGDPKQKEDCLKLVEQYAGVPRASIPRHPEVGAAASQCLLKMISGEMIFYRGGAISEEVIKLFSETIPRVGGAHEAV